MIKIATFADYMAANYPWVQPGGSIWRELSHAFGAGFKAGKDAKE